MPRYSVIAFVIVCCVWLGAVLVDRSGPQPVEPVVPQAPPTWDRPPDWPRDELAPEPEVDLRAEPGEGDLRRLPSVAASAPAAAAPSQSNLARVAESERSPPDVHRLPAIHSADTHVQPTGYVSRDDESSTHATGESPPDLEFPVEERADPLPQKRQPTETIREEAEPLLSAPDAAFEMPLAEPVLNEPVLNEPVLNEPVLNEPVLNEPVLNEPVLNEPVLNEPVLNEPVLNEPVLNEPVLNEPKWDMSPLQVAALPGGAEGGAGRREASVPESHRAGYKLEQRPTMSRDSSGEVDLPPQVSSRAATMLNEASQLADRGGLFAARDQFLRVMRMICQSLDSRVGQPLHTQALANGLRALEEADDFALTGETAESDLHLQGFIEGHRTPVLKGESEEGLTALLAMQRYYKYAYQQLALAGNGQPAASRALYSLGRIEALLCEARGAASGGGPKALALFHAAVTADASNSRAANELGVMLARRGCLTEAQGVLQQAASVAADSTVLQNLAVVHRQLGDRLAAEQVAQQAALVAARRPPAARGQRGRVQWVDHATFAQAGDRSTMPPGQLPLQPSVSVPARATSPTGGAPVSRPTAARMARQESGMWAF